MSAVVSKITDEDMGTNKIILVSEDFEDIEVLRQHMADVILSYVYTLSCCN